MAATATAFASTSTAPNPVVTFSTPGNKQVQLQVCNAFGCTTTVKTVAVRNPSPSVTVLTVNPETVPQGGVVQLSGAGLGAPPLTFRWRVLDGNGVTMATLFGASANWTASAPPGSYPVFLDLSNSFGTHTPLPGWITVVASPPIFSDGFEGGLGPWLVRP